MPSPCWIFVTRSADRKTVDCKICKKRMSNCSRSTSNIMRHVKLWHPEEWQAEMRKPTAACKQLASTRTNESQSSVAVDEASSSTPKPDQSVQAVDRMANKKYLYQTDPIRKIELDEHVVDLILLDMQPLSIVDDKGFRKLVNALDSRYEIISKERLQHRLLPNRYAQEKERLIEVLRSVKQVCLAVDCWTSHSEDVYITTTAHYITPAWEWKAHVVNTRCMGKRLVWDNFASELQIVLREFEIEEKVTTIVTDTDNANYLSNILEGTKTRQHVCFAQRLSLAVKDAIEEEEETFTLLNKVRDIVTYFHSNTEARNSLSDLHVSREKTVQKLKQDVESRWNSIYDMLESYIDQHEEVTTVLCLAGHNSMCLSTTDVLTVRRVMDILEPFYEATVELSTERNTSASKIIPMVNILRKLTAKSDSPLSKMLNDMLSKRFAGIENTTCLLLATLLDPRFRKSAFFTPETATKAVDTLRETIQANELAVELLEDIKDEPASPRPKKPSLLWSEFDEEMANSQQTTTKPLTQSTSVEMEIRLYLESPALPREKDPFMWWRENVPLLPKLEAIARDVLAIPASFVPGERIFTRAGEFFSLRRSSLEKSCVDMILFLNKD